MEFEDVKELVGKEEYEGSEDVGVGVEDDDEEEVVVLEVAVDKVAVGVEVEEEEEGGELEEGEDEDFEELAAALESEEGTEGKWLRDLAVSLVL